MSFPDLLNRLPAYQGRFDARRIQSDDADVFFASYPAGTTIEPHSHDTENVGLVVSGALLMVVNGKEERYTQGEWYHIDRDAEHSARFEEDTAIIECWVKEQAA